MTTNPDEHFKYYHYRPSLAAACLFAILFGLSTGWHLLLIAKRRTWYFTPLLIGGICMCHTYLTTVLWPPYDVLILIHIVEIVGYATRSVSNKQAPNLTLAPFVIQSLLLLVAPALLAASIYMILGRIIISVNGEKYSLVKTRWLTTIFVTSDVLSFLIQLGGMY